MASLIRRGKEFAKGLLQHVFHLGQRVGVDLLPRHFYSSIPDFRELSAEAAWKQPRTMVGVHGADVDGQLRFVAETCPAEIREITRQEDLCAQTVAEGGEAGFGPIETDFLYCFIRTHRPARITQVGAGFSTALILRAARDAGYAPSITVVEPYPSEFLRRCGSDGRIRLIARKAQSVELSIFTDVGPGGLLFIDSTHTVKAGSEVNHMILEVLPRLPAGAFVHFHDIYFPYDYQRQLMTDVTFWSESTLLHAFLIGNSNCAIGASLSMLHYARPEQLKQLLPRYQPQPNDHGLRAPGEGHFPSSIYLRIQ
jgi:predicted O-methyltransferase YrrM